MRRAGLALVLAGVMAPLVPLAVWAFARSWYFPDLVPARWSWQAWSALPRSGVPGSLAVSIAIALSVTLIAALAGIPAGRALAMHRFRGRGLVVALIAAPAVLPGLAVVFGLQAVFLRLGLTGTAAGVVLAHVVPALPYMVLAAAAVFAGHDRGLEDQARSLGATRAEAIRLVALPALMPGLLAGGLFTFLVSWSQYLLTLVIGGGRVQTLPLVLFNAAAAGRNDVTGAVALVYAAPAVAILLVTSARITGRSLALR